MAKKTTNTNANPKKSNTTTAKRASNKAPKDFNMLKAIREEKDYKSNILRRDKNVRNMLKTIYQLQAKDQFSQVS
jgi:hypothetical protein